MCWTVAFVDGEWVEQCGGIKGDGGGGWAARCPTEGGTDEVREKWREKKCNTSWRKGTFQRGRFLFLKSEPETETALTPELQEVAGDQTVSNPSMPHKRKFEWTAAIMLRVNYLVQLDVCLTAQECALTVRPK